MMKVNPRTARWLTAVPLAALLLSASYQIGCAANARVSSVPPEPVAADAARTVLVELFTSEGCSTCPPADKLLMDLDQSQPIKGVRVIALSEHVDYWNHLGWKDPYSSAEFTQRQSDYARALGIEDIYTPQMVVDGQVAFVGSNQAKAREAITGAAAAPRADVGVSIKASTRKNVTLSVRVDNLPQVSTGNAADVFVAITESGLANSVSKGENAGRTLAHSAVTRKLTKLGRIEGATFTAEQPIDLDARWNRSQMKAVAFVQDRVSRRVLGSAATSFAEVQ